MVLGSIAMLVLIQNKLLLLSSNSTTMDKITKFLSKLTHKEQEKILHIIQLINM